MTFPRLGGAVDIPRVVVTRLHPDQSSVPESAHMQGHVPEAPTSTLSAPISLFQV